MRRISVLIALVLSASACGDDSIGAPPDAAPLAPGVKVSGQIVRAPGQPVPIADVTVSAGTVPSDENLSETRSAQITIPQGTLLEFPYASPLLVNVTRVDLSAIPAPLPLASDGRRYTQYFVTLQPSGLELVDMQ